MAYHLVRVRRDDLLDADTFARAAGLHPELVRRFVALGLVEAAADASGRLWLPRSQLAVVGRIQRLRAALPVNYAALGLVIDLLDRVAELEAALRRRHAAPPDVVPGRTGQRHEGRVRPLARRPPGEHSRSTGG